MTRRQGAPLRLEVDTSAVLDSLQRQRLRLIEALEQLDAAEWRAPTRCPAWTVGEVVAHLCWSNEVGLELIRRAAQGSAERLFEGFDPRVTPDATLGERRGRSPAEHLAAVRSGTDALLAAARDLAAGGLVAEADTPLGWVPWPLAVDHILWDSWLHERDVLVPLGHAVAPDPVEVALVATYQLVPVGTVLGAMGLHGEVDLRLDGVGGGAYRVRVGDAVVIDHPDEPPGEEGCITGEAVAVIEAISGRGDLGTAASGPPPMLRRAGGLARRLAGV